MRCKRDRRLDENEFNAYMPTIKSKKTRKMIRSISFVLMAVLLFLGGVASVWFTLDEEIRTLVKVKQTIDRQYYQEILDEEFYQAVFDGVNSLLDPYSYYMTAQEYKEASNHLNGRRIGLGLYLSSEEIEKGKLKIAKVGGNSPAERAGITVGSYIIGYGQTETEMATGGRYEEFIAFLGALDEGEVFYLQLERMGEMRVVAIAQESYVENYVFYRSNNTAYVFTGEYADELTEVNNPLSVLPEDTAYIRLAKFGGEAVERFGVAMSVFKRENKKNLILDLRGNGGGYMKVMQGIAAYFCKGSDQLRPLAAIADYGEKEEYFYASANLYAEYFAEDSRICILADNGSASASECLIGVAVDYGAVAYQDICLISREGIAKTYGKGIMQSYFPLGVSGEQLKLTTAEVRWPITRKSIHARGVLPEDGAKTVEEGTTEEEELASAIAVLFS